MDATNLSNSKWDNFIAKTKHDFPDINFIQSDYTAWSPRTKSIHYSLKNSFKDSSSSILHELGHFMANHNDYSNDIRLLIMENEAWQKALEIAPKYNVQIDIDHIEDCMDTYRDWLHKRSTCPNCQQNGIQETANLYSCINCLEKWNVSQSRFCRAYRMKIKDRP